MSQAGYSPKRNAAARFVASARVGAVLLFLAATGAKAQIAASVSPPQFTAPILASPFPGAVPIVSAIGVSLSKPDGSAGLGGVDSGDSGVAGVSGVASLAQPTGSEGTGRSPKIAAVNSSRSFSRLKPGVSVGASTSTVRLLSAPLGFGSHEFVATVGPERAIGMAALNTIRSESAAYSKLDVLSPEVIASRHTRLSATNFGSHSLSGPTSPSTGFAFHSFVTGVNLPHARGLQRTNPLNRSRTDLTNSGRISNGLGGGKLPGAGSSVPKIPKVGIGSLTSTMPHF